MVTGYEVEFYNNIGYIVKGLGAIFSEMKKSNELREIEIELRQKELERLDRIIEKIGEKKNNDQR